MWVPARTHLRILGKGTSWFAAVYCLTRISDSNQSRAVKDHERAIELSNAILQQQHEQDSSKNKKSDFNLLRNREIELRRHYLELQALAGELSQELSQLEGETSSSSSGVDVTG
ncbi:hypothetical protein FRC20_009352 [Serendipita sp. 405]|nr:hypothetical protein FRC15_006320 [Serendipita sp. 397]KAG8810228.1 hypothetical protein FRC18_004189 [Serendipita sp. 400]KAG8878067.1 hypothetical protein FRC20_009352 [Serendipita sp. 405]